MKFFGESIYLSNMNRPAPVSRALLTGGGTLATFYASHRLTKALTPKQVTPAVICGSYVLGIGVFWTGYELWLDVATHSRSLLHFTAVRGLGVGGMLFGGWLIAKAMVTMI